MTRCEDYPCCGHTDGLGCDWTSPNDDPELWFCMHYEHESGAWHRVGEQCPIVRWEMEQDELEERMYRDHEDGSHKAIPVGECDDCQREQVYYIIRRSDDGDYPMSDGVTYTQTWDAEETIIEWGNEDDCRWHGQWDVVSTLDERPRDWINNRCERCYSHAEWNAGEGGNFRNRYDIVGRAGRTPVWWHRIPPWRKLPFSFTQELMWWGSTDTQLHHVGDNYPTPSPRR